MKKKTIVIAVIAIAVIASVVIFAGHVKKPVEVNQLTTHTAGDWSPVWSPDGRKIVFSSKRTGNSDIWVIDSDGGNLRQLTRHTAGDSSPVWSPDGKKIAFMSGQAGNIDIWVLILE